MVCRVVNVEVGSAEALAICVWRSFCVHTRYCQTVGPIEMDKHDANWCHFLINTLFQFIHWSCADILQSSFHHSIGPANWISSYILIFEFSCDYSIFELESERFWLMNWVLWLLNTFIELIWMCWDFSFRFFWRNKKW